MREMNTKINKAFYLVPILFAVITGFLLFLEFSDRDKFFNIQIEQIRLSGTGEAGLNKNSISNVKLAVPGLLFNLSKEPVVIIDNEGNRSYSKLSGYKAEESGFTFSFGNSLEIKIISEGPENTTIDIYYPKNNSGSFIIPAEAMSDLHQVSFLPCYSFNVSGSSYILVSASGSVFDMTAGSLTVPFSGNSASIVIEEIADMDPLQYYFFGKSGPVPTDLYESTVETFIGKAYEGWRTTRFDQEESGWILADGSYGLDNDLLASYLSESLKRGRFSQIEKIVETISGREDKFSFLSAPFTGNIVDTDSSRRVQNDTLKKRISIAVKSGDLGLFRESDLMRELRWISSSALIGDFSSFVSSIDLSKRFEPGVLTGMVEVYKDSLKAESGQYRDLMRLYSVIEEQVFTSLIRINDGLYLTGGEGGLTDTMLSARMGLALYEIGQLESNSLFEKIGRSMIVSVLSLADNSGLIPENIDREGKFNGVSYYGADTLYSNLVSNEYYPHVVNFRGTAGTDISVWTVANSVSYKSTAASSVFSFTYPRGGVHHLVIKGIEPFKSLQMNGINWNSDKRFQYYSSGWVYNRDEKTLYIKLTQKRISEKVILNY